MTEPLKIYEMSPGESVLVRLPNRIGFVEIRTDGVNGPTGYPVVGVDVVSETKHTDAADGRRYWPQHDHDCGVVLVGEPGPKMLEQERFTKQLAEVIKAHDRGEHTRCPESCPAKAAEADHDHVFQPNGLRICTASLGCSMTYDKYQETKR